MLLIHSPTFICASTTTEKLDVEVKAIVVPDPPVPFASSNNAPFSVVLVIKDLYHHINQCPNHNL